MKEFIIHPVNEETEKEFIDHGAPELVRCKDCKHGTLYCTEDTNGETLYECNNPEIGDMVAVHSWKWFCADGVAKDGEQE